MVDSLSKHMNASVIFLSTVSLGTLLLGLYAWRLTSSRPLILNVLFASTAFLITAYGVASKQSSDLIFVMPFLVTMLLAGRTLGLYWRIFRQGEHQWSVPGHLLGSASVMCLAGTYVAFLNL